MKLLARIVLALGLIAAVAPPLLAADHDPLFINLTSDDGHRAQMALVFGAKQQQLGHPLTVWLNDKAVNLGAKTKAAEFAAQQQTLTEMMGKGAKVVVCPMCMKHYGVAETDLLPGLEIGNPEMTGAALFADGARALSW